MTEREKREKVINGLECCWDVQSGWKDARYVCPTCPYTDNGIPCETLAPLVEDALALLKAQEARVFNVGDFYGEEFGYLEYRTDRPGFSNFEPSPVLISNIDEENVTVIFRSASVQKLPLDRMNKNWRIWSDYPTHELLRAVKWDE